MMEKHTPEPWVILTHGTREGGVTIPDQFWIVPEFRDGRWKERIAIINFPSPYQNQEANADRIVACVNACAGINPEAVPDLLAALKRVVPWIGLLIAHDGHKESVAPLDCENALAQAEAAIEKAGKV